MSALGSDSAGFQFSDAELTAILRRRLGVVPVESGEERGALN